MSLKVPAHYLLKFQPVMRINTASKQSCLAIIFLLLWLTLPALAGSAWTWTTKVVKSNSARCSFEWTVPVLTATPGDSSNWQKQIDRLIDKRKAEFLSDYQNSRASDENLAKELPDFTPPSWGSSCSFKAVWSDPDRLILLWSGYDYRGGAHGIPIQEVMILDREHPDSLQTSPSLFKDPTQALKKLSSYCRAKLTSLIEDSDADWIKQGTEPKWENFSLVYPSYLDGQARFQVIFSPYQVAPYAAGSPTLTIPWQELKPFISRLENGVPLP